MLPVACVHTLMPLRQQWPCLVPGLGAGHVIAATTLAGLPVSLDVRIGAEVRRGVSYGAVVPLPENVVVLPRRVIAAPILATSNGNAS